jgi:hypothetical protein
MSAGHDEFEVLCALAVSGDLTETEHAALREHLRDCIPCQTCLVEMRRLAIPLLFAQKLKSPGKQLRKGLRERFAERAIREGIPLSPRSDGVGFSALGMVTVVLVVLLLVTATLQHSPSRSSIVETGVAESAQLAPLHSPKSMMSLAVPARGRRIRRDHKTAASPVAKAGFRTLEPAALSGHPFTFTLDARSFARRAYPLSTTMKLTEVVPSWAVPSRASRFTLDTASHVFRYNAPSEHGAFAPRYLLSNLATQRFDLETHRNTWKANFKTSGFELIHNVVSETAGQESSQ